MTPYLTVKKAALENENISNEENSHDNVGMCECGEHCSIQVTETVLHSCSHKKVV